MLSSQAPNFTLESSTGHQVALADLQGSYVVLIFYPANETPTCNRQLSEMNVNLEDFLQSNARLFGVNTGSAEQQKSYCERRRLQFPILSDPGCKVAKQYGAALPFFSFVIRRTVVAIDPHGHICFYQHGKPSPEEILAAIKRHSQDHGQAASRA